MKATYGIRWQTPNMPGPAYSYCCSKHALRAKGLLLNKEAKIQQTPMPKYPEVECEECESQCIQCGSSTEDGEGWDGLCGNCADAAE